MTSTDNLSKGMFMINSQYHFNRFSIGGGVGLGKIDLLRLNHLY